MICFKVHTKHSLIVFVDLRNTKKTCKNDLWNPKIVGVVHLGQFTAFSLWKFWKWTVYYSLTLVKTGVSKKISYELKHIFNLQKVFQSIFSTALVHIYITICKVFLLIRAVALDISKALQSLACWSFSQT